MPLSSPQLLRRRTKIVATVGPSSRSPEMLTQLVWAGVNVFRLNCSHGSHPEHREGYERVRSVAAEVGEPIAVLADLSGPKVRVGKFEGGQVMLGAGDHVIVTTRDVVGRPGLIP